MNTKLDQIHYEKLLQMQSQMLVRWLCLVTKRIDSFIIPEVDKTECELWILTRFVGTILAAHKNTSQEFDVGKFLAMVHGHTELITKLNKTQPIADGDTI